MRFCLMLFFCGCLSAAWGRDYGEIVVIAGENANPVEKNVAALLVSRISESTAVPVRQRVGADLANLYAKDSLALLIYVGIPANHRELHALLRANRIPPLSEQHPGPEGFLLKTVQSEGIAAGIVLVAGVDDRGTLYGTGELLRQIDFDKNSIRLAAVSIRTAPAFEVRGTQYGQSHVAKQLANVRAWTTEETHRAILDDALAGANTFLTEGAGLDVPFMKSFDLMTASVYSPNVAPEKGLPRDWLAKESIGREGYLCPSVPEAHDYLLKKCDAYFRTSPSFDFVQLKGGDGGGCECDRCKPYGGTFIRLAEKMAAIIHRYHPETRIYFTNQKFDNEGDSAIFAYLQEQPRDWLWAWGYGPGSDATTWQPGHRQNHRMDLFRYPGYGPYGLYPQEILHQLPPRHKILYFNEVTHWKYAQHGYIQMYPRADKDGNLPPRWSHEIYERRPDQTLTMVYNRLSFYAWPVYYHRVFNDLMRYGVGDITHSSGNHDHFNQWMWQRLLWSPRMTAEEAVQEYAAAWFGKAAAPAMARAILLLEQNMEENVPLNRKDGIEEYYRLVKAAGEQMPEMIRANSWLWRMYLQKGALDAYVKQDLIRQMACQQRVEEHVRKHGPEMTGIPGLITAIDSVLASRTPEMTALLREAEKLGEESNRLFGTRSEGLYNLQHDYVGLGWLKRQLSRVLAAGSAQEREELLYLITDYDNPGEGGFYDNLGTGNKCPNVVFGYPYDHGQPYVSEMLSEANRPSQRSMHFTQDEDQGVTLHYVGLQPDTPYRLRLTLVRPWYQERYRSRMNQTSQSVYANGRLLARDVEVPEQMSDFYQVEIPASLIGANGELTIRLERNAGVANGSRTSIEQWRNSGGWGTILSEAWLLKGR